MSDPAQAAGIVGLGMTRMSTEPGGHADSLAAQAIDAALLDAGVERADIDGLLVGSSQGVRPDRVGLDLAARAGLGTLDLLEHIELKGCTAVAMVAHAALSIRAGLARRVLCVFGDAPLRIGGSAGSTYDASGGNTGVRGLERASGVLGSVPTYALLASRYLAVSGNTPADLGAVAVSARAWAVGNPDATARTPLDIAGYEASRMVAEPLRVLDCARPVNGAVALLVAATEDSYVQNPLHIRGFGQSHPRRRRRGPGESWFGGGGAALDTALRTAGRTRGDLDVIELYDPFSVVTLCLLDEYGLVGEGPVGAFVRAGGIAPGGSLPVNTGGGQLSGFYLQGMTPLAEAVIQLRGAGGDRQVAGAHTALVAGIGGRLDHHASLVLEAA